VPDAYATKLRRADLGVEWVRIEGGSGLEDMWGSMTFAPDGSGIPGKGSVYASGYAIWSDWGARPGFEPLRGMENALLVKYDDAGTRQWVRQFGADLESEYAWDHVALPGGDVLVVGTTLGDFDGQSNAGETDGFLRRMGPDGSVRWTRFYGTAGSEQLWDATVHGGSVYVLGTADGPYAGRHRGEQDVVVLKVDLDGRVLARRQLGTERFDMAGSIVARGGRLLVTGTTEGSLSGPHRGGVTDVYAVELRTCDLRDPNASLGRWWCGARWLSGQR
jgi:hypothetical protein